MISLRNAAWWSKVTEWSVMVNGRGITRDAKTIVPRQSSLSNDYENCAVERKKLLTKGFSY